MTKMIVGLDSILLYFHLSTNKQKQKNLSSTTALPRFFTKSSRESDCSLVAVAFAFCPSTLILPKVLNTMSKVLHFILQLLCYST